MDQPYPNSAAWVGEVVDAEGRPVFSRNWGEQADALRYVIRLVNWAARLSVADGPGPEERPELLCATCGHGQRRHSSFGTCDGDGTECYCVRFPDAPDFAALPEHREETGR